MTASTNHIEKHIQASYFSLRLGMGIIGIALPPVLWLVALKCHGLLPSMSAYYHSVSRDIFVGSLFAIGAAAYLYKGYTQKENIAMNLAGLSAVGVAIFPTDCSKITEVVCKESAFKITHILHISFAVLFFLLIAYVCIFLSNDTLKFVSDDAKRKRYKFIYRIIGALMILLPILVFIQDFGYMNIAPGKTTLFWMEALAIWSFAAFWLLKSKEIKESSFNSKNMTTNFMLH